MFTLIFRPEAVPAPPELDDGDVSFCLLAFSNQNLSAMVLGRIHLSSVWAFGVGHACLRRWKLEGRKTAPGPSREERRVVLVRTTPFSFRTNM